jgi:DNA-binding transcriptional regulator YhcF (GntR family)
MNAETLIQRRWKIIHESSVPPYEQIRLRIVDMIAGGVLPVGTKLPSVRALSTDLGVAVNTVARAYRELEHVGIVETNGRSGTVIASGGDEMTEIVAAAAAEFAAVVLQHGVPAAKALGMVSAALDRGITP